MSKPIKPTAAQVKLLLQFLEAGVWLDARPQTIYACYRRGWINCNEAVGPSSHWRLTHAGYAALAAADKEGKR